MSFIVVRRLLLSNCRRNLTYDIKEKINFSSAPFKNKNISIPKQFVRHNLCTTNISLFHSSEFKNKLQTLNEKEYSDISGLPIKKRPARRKKSVSYEEHLMPGVWNVKAMATAEEYDLEQLELALKKQELYMPNKVHISTDPIPDVILAVPKYKIGDESREVFFFREGTIVLWNISELESGNILQFLKPFEENSYLESVVQAESELMTYAYAESGKRSYLRDGNIILSSNVTTIEKFTFSNAISQSVKLGIWEASLDCYVDSIEYVTDDLKSGRRLRISREEVLRKQGELFTLRHFINLSSDLLDTPDYYWERDDLANLFQQICKYLSIAKRTRVMNEKLNHCVELLGILSTHLSDRHHVRLEWMIIILIMVEVGFEVLHYVDRYFVS